MDFKTKKRYKRNYKIFYTIVMTSFILFGLCCFILLCICLIYKEPNLNFLRLAIAGVISAIIFTVSMIFLAYYSYQLHTYKTNIKKYRQSRVFIRIINMIQSNQLEDARILYTYIDKNTSEKIFLNGFLLHALLNSDDNEFIRDRCKIRLTEILDKNNPEKIFN